ncbi:hypothetical protein [Bacillus massiliglaciei]|uniref:hypothetical protein n=1 Tax=Bacillus massiliglaciei TaxID=1816693 RepID=UPI000DA60E88|nr:hypothetical protein [Bacillus massiliglaciei]
MKARYELKDLAITLSNVTLKNAAESYVLLKATDENENELTIEFSHEQAKLLEAQFAEVNRRRKNHNYQAQYMNDELEEEYNLFNIDTFKEE